MESKTPVFVRIEDYKDVLDIMELVKSKIHEANQTIEQINVLKNQEDSELELWKNELADVERKMDYMDKTLFEPDNI
jgi:hypothetical protein